MISKICICIVTFLVAIPLLAGVGEARSVNVEFNLDNPKTGVEKKLFIDRATLEAQSRMLDIYYENVSFIPTWSKDPIVGVLARSCGRLLINQPLLQGSRLRREKGLVMNGNLLLAAIFRTHHPGLMTKH